MSKAKDDKIAELLRALDEADDNCRRLTHLYFKAHRDSLEALAERDKLREELRVLKSVVPSGRHDL